MIPSTESSVGLSAQPQPPRGRARPTALDLSAPLPLPKDDTALANRAPSAASSDGGFSPVAGSATTWKAVYTIIERGRTRKHWLRIGTAFVNRDGSFNVRLDAVPLNGQLHIRDVLPREGPDGRAGASFPSEREQRAPW